MPDSKALVPSKFPCRHFRESMGRIEQEPAKATFLARAVEVEDKFSIKLEVEISLVHGFNGGGDAGKDYFRARLEAVDRRRGDIADEDRASVMMRASFDDARSLAHWLLSQDLENALRVGIVRVPPTPKPSHERSLGLVLFSFANDILMRLMDLEEDLKIRKNSRSWLGKKESSL